MSESGEIARFTPRTPQEALLRMIWTTGLQPAILPILIDEFYREWGNRCPQGAKWDGPPLSRERWRDLVRNGQLINFPPRTKAEAMTRMGWIASYGGYRWGTAVSQVYADYYNRGFGSACAAPSGSFTQRDDPQVNVGGRWRGASTSSTADFRGGGCIGTRLRELDLPLSSDVVLTLNQSGAHVQGSQDAVTVFADAEPVVNSCEFSGIVVGNALHGTVCDGTTEDFGVIQGCGSEPWTLEWERLAFSGTVNRSRMEISISQRGVVHNGSASFGMSSSVHFTLQK